MKAGLVGGKCSNRMNETKVVERWSSASMSEKLATVEFENVECPPRPLSMVGRAETVCCRYLDGKVCKDLD